MMRFCTCTETAVNTLRAAQGDAVTDSTVREDITFTSSSAAARFVAGNSRNGKITWKTKNGTLLRDAFHRDK
ncbi:DUF4357 domain-containing protein [Corynebacterium aquilae]|uniref:DUF4357 domain-containing protein n=1 Tax=Corynebacterium aquilae TaxID=203263 RepID=UPI0009516F76